MTSTFDRLVTDFDSPAISLEISADLIIIYLSVLIITCHTRKQGIRLLDLHKIRNHVD